MRLISRAWRFSSACWALHHSWSAIQVEGELSSHKGINLFLHLHVSWQNLNVCPYRKKKRFHDGKFDTERDYFRPSIRFRQHTVHHAQLWVNILISQLHWGRLKMSLKKIILKKFNKNVKTDLLLWFMGNKGGSIALAQSIQQRAA